MRLLESAHGSCVGAAWVAAGASGQDVTWTGVSRLARLGAVIEPNPANAAIYDRGYGEFRALYMALKPVFHMRSQ